MRGLEAVDYFLIPVFQRASQHCSKCGVGAGGVALSLCVIVKAIVGRVRGYDYEGRMGKETREREGKLHGPARPLHLLDYV